jgi:outer membrane receptor protein involved in Fe transport
MRKKKKLAILASCMVMCSAGFMAVAEAEEPAGTGSDTVLEEVVVTASTFKQLNPVKFTVIDEAEIKAKGAQNVAEALKDVPGLFINQNSSKGKAVAQFRGSDGDNTRIFVDGVPLNPVGDGKVDLRAIPADNIEKIEIIKGAVPVMYGTDAPGGLIYITTKKAGNKSAQSLSYTTGTDNDEKYYLSLAGQRGKINYLFGYKTEDTDGYTAHSKIDADNFNGKLSWDLGPKSNLTVFGSYSERQEQLPNRIDPINGKLILNTGQGGTISAKNNWWSYTYDWAYDPIRNSYLGLLYNYRLNDKSDLNLRVYRSHEDSHLSAQGWGVFYAQPDNTAHQYWDGSVRGWELQHNIRTSTANTMTWGYNYETRDFTEQTSATWPFPQINPVTGKLDYYVTFFNQGTYDYTGKSFYLQDTTQVNRKLSTSLGYRHYEVEDHAAIDTIAFTAPAPQHGVGTADDPVASFNYALSGTTNLHGSVGKSFRWPNAKERSGPGGIYGLPTELYGSNATGYTGNGAGPDGMGIVCNYLLPEEAINRELGVGYQKHGLKADITFFKRDITNMIKGYGFGQGHTQYFNIPNVDMQGYELEVNKKIRNGLKAFFNYTYTDAYDPEVKEQVRDIPKQKCSFGLDYAGTDGVHANLALNHLGSRVSAFSNGNGNANGDDPRKAIAQTLPSYSVVDFKVSKTVENLDYWVRILNLFDEKYYQGAYLVAPGRYVEVGTTIKL